MAKVLRQANRKRSTWNLLGNKKGCKERGSSGTKDTEGTVWRTSGHRRGAGNGVQNCKANSKRDIRCDKYHLLKDETGPIVVHPDPDEITGMSKIYQAAVQCG